MREKKRTGVGALRVGFVGRIGTTIGVGADDSASPANTPVGDAPPLFAFSVFPSSTCTVFTVVTSGTDNREFDDGEGDGAMTSRRPCNTRRKRGGGVKRR